MDFISFNPGPLYFNTFNNFEIKIYLKFYMNFERYPNVLNLENRLKVIDNKFLNEYFNLEIGKGVGSEIIKCGTLQL